MKTIEQKAKTLLGAFGFTLCGNRIFQGNVYFGRTASNYVSAMEQLIPIIKDEEYFNGYARIMKIDYK